MYRWIETICILDGAILHLSDHQKRMDWTLRTCLGIQNEIRLEEFLQVSKYHQQGRVKCRVIYETQLIEISWEYYHIRPISSISLVQADHFQYSTKLADRTAFAQMIQEAGTDDVIIVKDGLITDSSYANLLFRKGQKWFTPSTPLLAGTQRKRLIESGEIIARPIRPENISEYDGFKYINAMMDLKYSPELPIEIIS